MSEKEITKKMVVILIIMLVYIFVSTKTCIASISHYWPWTILSFLLIWTPAILLRVSIKKRCEIKNKFQLGLATVLSLFSVIIMGSAIFMDSKNSQIHLHFSIWFLLTILVLTGWLIWIFKPEWISKLKKKK